MERFAWSRRSTSPRLWLKYTPSNSLQIPIHPHASPRSLTCELYSGVSICISAWVHCNDGVRERFQTRFDGQADFDPVRHCCVQCCYQAYGLSTATNFSDITADASLATLISDAYGGDVENVDAITGALAEDTNATTGGLLGDLLFEAWIDQLIRTIAGDRFYHFHGRSMETVANTTLSEVINRTLHVTDLPLSTFVIPSAVVCASDCEVFGVADVTLSDSFGIAWQVRKRSMCEEAGLYYIRGNNPLG